MPANPISTLTRQQLGAVFKDWRTLQAFEAFQDQIANAIPASIAGLTSVEFLVTSPDPTNAPNARVLAAGAGISLTPSAGLLTVSLSGAIVSSFSGGTTGLTPSSPTGGAITLSGTLAIANGGTGATTAATARTALGLGGAAVLNVGTAPSTVAAGDDVRFANAKPSYATVVTDADFTITRSASMNYVRHTGTLTANRAVTLSTTGAVAGDAVLLTRTGSGLFNLTFAGKALITNTYAQAIYDGSAWYLATTGLL